MEVGNYYLERLVRDPAGASGWAVYEYLPNGQIGPMIGTLTCKDRSKGWDWRPMSPTRLAYSRRFRTLREAVEVIERERLSM